MKTQSRHTRTLNHSTENLVNVEGDSVLDQSLPAIGMKNRVQRSQSQANSQIGMGEEYDDARIYYGLSSEASLQQSIEYFLIQVNNITRKTGLINEQYANYKIELSELQKEFDGLKANLEENIMNKRVKAMSVAGKANSAQMRVNQISNDIALLRHSIDDRRIDETHFDQQLKINRAKLRIKEREIFESVHQSDTTKQRVRHLLAGFGKLSLSQPMSGPESEKGKAMLKQMIDDSKRERVVNLHKPRNIDISLEKHLENWQLSSRKLMGDRIARVTKKSKVKNDMVLQYIESMQTFDTLFHAIKHKESIDSVEEIISTIDRMEERLKDLIMRKTDLETETQRVQRDIDKDKEFIVDALGTSSKYNEDEQYREAEERIKRTHLDKILTL